MSSLLLNLNRDPQSRVSLNFAGRESAPTAPHSTILRSYGNHTARMTGQEADINVLSRYVVNPGAFLEAHNREKEQYAKIAEKIKKGGR